MSEYTEVGQPFLARVEELGSETIVWTESAVTRDVL